MLPNRAMCALARGQAPVSVQRYFTGAATHSASPTVLLGQDRQADHSFRDPADATHKRIVTSGLDPTVGGTPLKISEDGRLAIENAGAARQAKVFFAEPGIVAKSNTALLKRGSKYLLSVQQAGAINVNDAKGKSHTLDALEPVINPDAETRSSPKKVAGRMAGQTHGTNVGVEATCVAVAEAIIGKKYSAALNPKMLEKMKLFTTTEALAWGTAIADAMTKGGKRKQGTLDETAVAQAYGTFVDAHPVAAAKLAKKLKVNEYAAPKVGQAYVSEAVGAVAIGAGITNWLVDPTGGTTTDLLTTDVTVRGGKRRTGWGNHVGAVVAESGGNRVTFENYARSGEDDTGKDNDEIYYFAMYGPASQPTQTWHHAWSQGGAPVANAVTGVIG